MLVLSLRIYDVLFVKEENRKSLGNASITDPLDLEEFEKRSKFLVIIIFTITFRTDTAGY